MFLPLAVLAFFINTGNVLVIGLLIYAFVYRPLLDGERLVSNGVIDNKNRWKLFIPFYRYFNAKILYTNYSDK